MTVLYVFGGIIVALAVGNLVIDVSRGKRPRGGSRARGGRGWFFADTTGDYDGGGWSDCGGFGDGGGCDGGGE